MSDDMTQTPETEKAPAAKAKAPKATRTVENCKLPIATSQDSRADRGHHRSPRGEAGRVRTR
jgi:hypothetical protein